MISEYHPSRPEIVDLFSEEIDQLGGQITTRIFDGDNLFLKTTLPRVREVSRGDAIQHGVAVRTNHSQLIVHPYTFREVCRNGAIHIASLVSRTINLGESPSHKFGVEFEVREALRACAAGEPFKANVRDMKRAKLSPVEITIAMSEFLKRGVNEQHITQILGYLAETGEGADGYDLFNAITATARDIEDNEEEKWNLEAVGGGVFAWLKKPQSSTPGKKSRNLHSKKSEKKPTRLVK